MQEPGEFFTLLPFFLVLHFLFRTLSDILPVFIQRFPSFLATLCIFPGTFLSLIRLPFLFRIFRFSGALRSVFLLFAPFSVFYCIGLTVSVFYRIGLSVSVFC